MSNYIELSADWPGFLKAFAQVTADRFLDHEFPVETLLGAGRLITEGDILPALLLCNQAEQALELYDNFPEIPSEQGSTQVGVMMADEGYPAELRALVQQLWAAKYGEE